MTEPNHSGRVLGWALLALPFLGAALATQTYRHPEEGGMLIFFALLLLPLLTAALMVVDGRRRGSVGWGFAALTCAFWIIFYPVYLRIRDKTEDTKHHLPVGLVGVVLLVLGGVYANTIHLETETDCAWQGRDVLCRFRNPSWQLARGGCLVTVAQKKGSRTQQIGVYSYRAIGPYGELQVTASETMGSEAELLDVLLRDLCGEDPDPGKTCTLDWKPQPTP